MANQKNYDEYKDNFKYDFINVQVFSVQILAYLMCAECKTAGNLNLDVVERTGLASKFKLTCKNCNFQLEYCNSPAQEYQLEGKSFMLYPINFALVNAARLAGFGLAAAKRFCAYMGLNNPPKAWNVYQNILRDYFKNAAERSMDRALQEAKTQAIQTKGEDNLSASFDGSWMKRGFASLVGLVACVGMYTNKILGIEVLHKFCATCKGKMPCKKNELCSINYKGSAGGMEPVGTVKIIKRIFERTRLKITEFLGDGDSRAFKEAKKAVDWSMVKLECVNHVAKRMGGRLRKTVKESKTIVVYEGERKGLGGPGRLVNDAINKIQSFYNFIIHEGTSIGSPEQISEWTLAMFDHISSSNANPKHDDCDPRFCKYLKAIWDGEAYDHDDPAHFHIPMAVMKHVEDIFHDLADINLLSRVVHGKTQNANECFNSTVWNLLSKNGFANRPLVELAVYMAVCQYNEGQLSTLEVLTDLHFPVGKETAQRCKSMDKIRVEKRKKAESNKSKRKKLRSENEENEIPDYAPGLH